MAIKLFELGFVLKAIDQMSGVLKSVEQRVEHLNEGVKATAGWREAGQNLAIVGGAIAAVGGGIGLGLKAAVESSEEFEDHIARLATALGNVPDKAAKLAEAEEYVKQSSIATGYSVEQLTESLYQGLSGFLDMSQSMVVATEAAKLARATSGDLAETTSFLTTAMLNFSDPTKTAIQNATVLADRMTALQTQFKFTNLNDLTAAMGYAAPQAKALGISLDQTLGAMAAFSAAGERGSEAGTRFVEVTGQLLRAAPKLGIEIFRNADGSGIDFIRTLEGIRARFGDISKDPRVAAAFQKAFGLRAGPALALLLNNLDKYHQAVNGVANSTGAADRAESEFEKRGTLGWTKLAQAVHVLSVDLGAALAPSLVPIAEGLASMAARLGHFVEAHPKLVKFAVTFIAVGAAIAVVVGGLVALVGGFLALASFIAPIGIGAVATFAGITAAIAAVGAALAVFHGEITGFFTRLIPEVFLGGVHIIEALVKGLLHDLTAPARAIAQVASLIRAHLPFSPAKVGPLRDLHRVRIVETIAAAIRPAPIASAMRGALTPAFAGGGAGFAGGGVVINLHYAPVIGGDAGPEGFSPKRHVDEIERLLRERMGRRSRLAFE